MAQNYMLGRGTKVYIGRQGADTSLAFVPAKITAGAAALANATSITVTALASGVLIHAGSFLNFVNPTTGAKKLVRLTSDADATETTLTVAALTEPIENGDIALWPPILGQRTNSSVGGQGNRVNSFPYESGGYEDGFNATIANTCTLSGNYALQDAGYSYALRQFSLFEEVRLRLEFPPEKPGATRVRVVEGRFSITSIPRELPSDNIITSNIEGSFNGVPIDDYFTPLAYPA